MELSERDLIGTWDATDYVYDAADAFTRAALDGIQWAGDAKGTGGNPLHLGAYAWEPVSSRDLDGAWTNAADSPLTQVENALGDDRVVEIIELLRIKPDVFGDRLYYSLNGHGTGFWDMDFSRPEYRELADLVGHHSWGVEYDYDPVADPHGDNLTLRVVN